MKKIYFREDDFVEVYVKVARGQKKIVYNVPENGHYDITDDVMKIKINGVLVFERNSHVS